MSFAVRCRSIRSGRRTFTATSCRSLWVSLRARMRRRSRCGVHLRTYHSHMHAHTRTIHTRTCACACTSVNGLPQWQGPHATMQSGINTVGCGHCNIKLIMLDGCTRLLRAGLCAWRRHLAQHDDTARSRCTLFRGRNYRRPQAREDCHRDAGFYVRDLLRPKGGWAACVTSLIVYLSSAATAVSHHP